MAGVRQIERDTVVVQEPEQTETIDVRSDALVASQVVDYILGVVEIVLGLRFLFKLFGANPEAGFASFIYTVTDPLMAPFRGLFRSTSEQGAVFEWSVLIAMAVYALVAWAIIRLIEISATRSIERYEIHRH